MAASVLDSAEMGDLMKRVRRELAAIPEDEDRLHVTAVLPEGIRQR